MYFNQFYMERNNIVTIKSILKYCRLNIIVLYYIQFINNMICRKVVLNKLISQLIFFTFYVTVNYLL